MLEILAQALAAERCQARQDCCLHPAVLDLLEAAFGLVRDAKCFALHPADTSQPLDD